MLRLEPCTNEYRTSFTLVSTLSTLRLKLLPIKNSSQKSEHQTFIHENSIGHLANVDLKLWVGRYRVAKKNHLLSQLLDAENFAATSQSLSSSIWRLWGPIELNLQCPTTDSALKEMNKKAYIYIYIYIRWPNVSSSYAQAHDEPDFRISTSFWPHLNDSSTCVYQILSSFRCPKDA